MSDTPLSDLWESTEREHSSLWWETQRPPWWRRVIHDWWPDTPLERYAASMAVAYVVAIAVALAIVCRP